MTRRQKAIAFFVALCVLLVAAAISLNIGWIIANAGRITPIILGIVLFGLIIAGLIVYTVFLVLEIRRNEEHDSFINAVTHELKTPIASIKLYLETLQSRPVPEARRQEFYNIMLADAARLHHTVEQVLKRVSFARSARPWHAGQWTWRHSPPSAWNSPSCGTICRPTPSCSSRPTARRWSAATPRTCAPSSPISSTTR
jgi:hypothetical protein